MSDEIDVYADVPVSEPIDGEPGRLHIFTGSKLGAGKEHEICAGCGFDMRDPETGAAVIGMSITLDPKFAWAAPRHDTSKTLSFCWSCRLDSLGAKSRNPDACL